MKLKTKWTQAAHPSVWTNTHGDIVHTLGCVQVNGKLYERNRYPDSVSIDFSVRVVGGNVKRGLMFFAEFIRNQVMT